MKDGKINSLYALIFSLFENNVLMLLYLFTETNLEMWIPEFYIYEIKIKTESHVHWLGKEMHKCM